MASSSNNRNQVMNSNGGEPNQNKEHFTAEQINSFFNNTITTSQKELTNFLVTQEELVRKQLEEESNEHLKSLKERYMREIEEAKNRIVQLKNMHTEPELQVISWKAFAMSAEQRIELLRGTVAGLVERIHVLEARIIEYEYMHALSEEEEDSDEDEEDSDDAKSEVDEMEEHIDLTGKCRECKQRHASIVLVPCLHLCFCVECNERMQEKPACYLCGNDSTGWVRVRLE